MDPVGVAFLKQLLITIYPGFLFPPSKQMCHGGDCSVGRASFQRSLNSMTDAGSNPGRSVRWKGKILAAPYSGKHGKSTHLGNRTETNSHKGYNVAFATIRWRLESCFLAGDQPKKSFFYDNEDYRVSGDESRLKFSVSVSLRKPKNGKASILLRLMFHLITKKKKNSDTRSHYWR